jgi:hypothetical protein
MAARTSRYRENPDMLDEAPLEPHLRKIAVGRSCDGVANDLLRGLFIRTAYRALIGDSIPPTPASDAGAAQEALMRVQLCGGARLRFSRIVLALAGH